jgi:hypothetical protein
MYQNVDVHQPEVTSQHITTENENLHIPYYISMVLYALLLKFRGPDVFQSQISNFVVLMFFSRKYQISWS